MDATELVCSDAPPYQPPMVKAPTGQPDALAAWVERILEKQPTPEALQQILAMKAAWDDRRAAEVFADALAGFQAECPTIPKRRAVHNRADANGNQSVRYKYAAYEDIKIITKPYEKKYGISTSFSFDASEDGKLIGTCRVRVGSHYEDKTFAVRVPKGQGTNAAQDDGQALAYLKRYLYVAALDIVVADEDNDATGLWACIKPDQVAELEELIRKKKADLTRFLAWAAEVAKFDVPTLAELPASLYETAVDMLKRKGAGK